MLPITFMPEHKAPDTSPRHSAPEPKEGTATDSFSEVFDAQTPPEKHVAAPEPETDVAVADTEDTPVSEDLTDAPDIAAVEPDADPEVEGRKLAIGQTEEAHQPIKAGQPTTAPDAEVLEDARHEAGRRTGLATPPEAQGNVQAGSQKPEMAPQVSDPRSAEVAAEVVKRTPAGTGVSQAIEAVMKAPTKFANTPFAPEQMAQVMNATMKEARPVAETLEKMTRAMEARETARGAPASKETVQLVRAEPPQTAQPAEPKEAPTAAQPATPVVAEPGEGLFVDAVTKPGTAAEVQFHSGLETRSAMAPRFDQMLNQPEVPRHIARQMAEVLHNIGDGPVELTLNPEELGRVRMSMVTSENGITLTVIADRGETMDLMRRHIEQLTREFHALGYAQVAFSFGQNGQQTSADGGAGTQGGQGGSAGDAPDVDAVENVIHLSTGAGQGVDIRV